MNFDHFDKRLGDEYRGLSGILHVQSPGRSEVARYGHMLEIIRGRKYSEPYDYDAAAYLTKQIAFANDVKKLRKAGNLCWAGPDRPRHAKRFSWSGLRGPPMVPDEHETNSVKNARFETIRRVLLRCPLVEGRGSGLSRINSNTAWSQGTRLYFGVGGGSQQLTTGLPLDVVGMILLGEVLRRVLGIDQCTILCADVITRTNPFPPELVGRVLEGEQRIFQYLFHRLGLEHWNVVLQSELHKTEIGGEVDKANVFSIAATSCCHPTYVQMLQTIYRYISKGIASSPFRHLGVDARGHEDNWHFALETAATEYLVSNGVHLGWLIPGPKINSAEKLENLFKKYGKAAFKRMDEEPFDSFHECTLDVALAEGAWRTTNRITAVYARAGIRIPDPDNPLLVERAPPYITYDPDKRLLLCDDGEAIRRKIAGPHGFVRFPPQGELCRFWREFVGLCELLEFPCAGEHIVERVAAFADFVHEDRQLKLLYDNAFGWASRRG